jgi:hypothetical protein
MFKSTDLIFKTFKEYLSRDTIPVKMTNGGGKTCNQVIISKSSVFLLFKYIYFNLVSMNFCYEAHPIEP